MRIKLLVWLLTVSYLSVMGQSETTYRYWFDDDVLNFTEGRLSSTAKLELDVTSLETGLHSVSFQLQDTSGIWHASAMRNFYKIGINDTIAVAKVDYWFDGNMSNVMTLDGITGTHIIDVTNLSTGVHYATFTITDENGVFLDSKTALFYKTDEEAIIEAGYLEYWFDDKQQEKTRLNGLQGLYDIDVSSLSDGVHHITFILRGSKNEVLNSQHKFFYKTSKEAPLITKWRYTINHAHELSTLYELDTPVDSISLITMLPVATCPIRSSCFEYRAVDSIPTLYAKNDITFYFYDSDNNMSLYSAKYVDESVKETLNVEEIKMLSPGVSETMPRPAENKIQWYKFHAEAGDTIAFKCNYATTIQVFSPSGKEIYAASGSDAVSMNGCYTWENGTYYVAVHDVTASRCTTLKLDYMHMDRYDVVSQDADVVGDGGYNTITFYGNGFDDLYAVELYNALGDTIHCIDINHISNNDVSLTFNFEKVKLGNYSALFHFTTENKKFIDQIIVEPATEIELTTTVTYPTSHLIGSYATYNISVKNNSNMTAYYVPLELRLEVNSIEAIQDVRFGGDMPSNTLFNNLLNDSIDKGTKEIITSLSDLSQFIIITDSVKNVDYGIAQIILTLPPNSNKKMTVSIKTGSIVTLNSFISNSWIPMVERSQIATFKLKSNDTNFRDQMCCYKDRVECTADFVASVASIFLPPGVDCATSLALTGLEAAYDIWCSEGETASERFQNYLDNQGASLAMSLVDNIVGCLTGLGKLGEVRELLENINNGVNVSTSFFDCIAEYTKEQPNCPPTEPKGGKSTPVASFDPNDISGYVAESGSYYIGRDVEKVTYMIEFENDSTIATAPAHRILLSDTLDTNVFDINSIVPLKVQIGDKTYDFTSSNNLNVATIDMRPDINAIAQVSMSVDKSGVLSWILESLDPMTVEPTTEAMSGILPVNDAAGSGMGFITFSINLKKGIEDGTEVANMANIIFDTNDPISTPYWINETDYVNPVSRVDSLEIVNDSIINVKLAGFDERSGIWKYDLYYQPGTGSDWFLLAEGLTEPTFQCQVYEDVRYGFCAIATDMAGNKEVKTLEAEYVYLNGDITTSIETISFDNLNINDGVLYDLLGRRVLNPTPGIYIRNGKKILIK